MKVGFVTFKNAQNLKTQTVPQNKINCSQTMTSLPGYYYAPKLHFSASFNRELETLRGVHCPVCGTVTISQKQYDEIMDEVVKAANLKEFMRILSKYYENIIPNLRATVKFLDSVLKKEPDLQLSDLLAIAKAGSNKRITYALSNIADNSENLSKDPKYSERDSKLLKDFAKSVIKLKNGDYKDISIRSFKTLLKDTIMQMDSPDKEDLMIDFNAELAKKIFQRTVLSHGTNPQKSQKENMLNLARNIYQHSLSNTVKVRDLDEPYGYILECKCCSEHKLSFKQLFYSAKEEDKLNINQYFSDISEHISKGRLTLCPDYVPVVRRYLENKNKNSNKITAEILAKMRDDKFQIQKEIKFDITDLDDIPCAGCGKHNISHKHKLKIYEEIEASKNNIELADIMARNKGYVRDKYLPLYEYLEKTLRENPDMSQDEIIAKARSFSYDRLNVILKANIEYVKSLLNTKYFSHSDKVKLEEFVFKSENKYTDRIGGYFRLSNYNFLLSNTLVRMDSRIRHEMMKNIKFPIKKEYSAYMLLYPSRNATSKYDSDLKVTIQDFFKYAVNTKDHFVPKHRNGSNEEDNIITLCKDCNKEKGSLDTFIWNDRNPDFQKYLQNQVDFILDKIKSGELDKSKIKYLKNLQENVYYGTNGQVEIVCDTDFMI